MKILILNVKFVSHSLLWDNTDREDKHLCLY